MSGASLWERFRADRILDDCPIYDLHGHWGPFYGANLPMSDPGRAVDHLARCGVELLVFCSHGALFSPDIGNKSNVETVTKYPQRLKAYCGINPNYPDIIRRDLETYDDYSDVYVGFKLLASYHGVAVYDDRYRPVWEFANERSLPVLLHTWGGCGMCGYEPVKQVVGKYPNVKFLLGHSLHDRPDQAISIANEYPNVYLELCAVLDDRGVVDSFVEKVGSERLIFGTDFPWFGYGYYIGALLGADMTDEDRRNILYRNARRLLGLDADTKR